MDRSSRSTRAATSAGNSLGAAACSGLTCTWVQGSSFVAMKIGMTVPQQDTLEATLAGFEQGEGLGVHSLWISQPVGGFDALMVLALATGRTETARLGTAVVPTFASHTLVTARAVQTAAAAAPGRIVLGVGAGHRTWVEHEYGQRFDRPVALEQAGIPAAIVGSPGKFLKHNGA
jgi:alkanesulfonate monooxygenase SsuD/methylene tetrahydromethanopterin reductase-like flavin-dependent oxidoreductase (luciferase family)